MPVAARSTATIQSMIESSKHVVTTGLHPDPDVVSFRQGLPCVVLPVLLHRFHSRRGEGMGGGFEVASMSSQPMAALHLLSSAQSAA